MRVDTAALLLLATLAVAMLMLSIPMNVWQNRRRPVSMEIRAVVFTPPTQRSPPLNPNLRLRGGTASL